MHVYWSGIHTCHVPILVNNNILLSVRYLTIMDVGRVKSTKNEKKTTIPIVRPHKTLTDALAIVHVLIPYTHLFIIPTSGYHP